MTGFRERAFVPVLLFVGLVVSVVSSLGAPLIPELARNLHTSIGNAQWALTATLVVAAVASPLVGRMGDGRHRKRVIVICLSAVVLGGALAAVSTSLPVLVIGRALQGLGLALMPLTMAAAREHLPAERSARAIAGISVIGAAGVGLGYPVTGLIADHFDVAAAYWFGTAVSAGALALAVLVIPDADVPASDAHLDIAGAVISGFGLIAMLIALEKAPDWGWASTRTPVLLVAGLALMAVWVRHELRTAAPLVDLRLARHPAVLTANVSGFLLGVTMYLLMVVITQFVQLPGFGLGETVFVAGLALVPLSVLSGLSSRTLPWLEERIGIRAIVPGGALAVAASAALFAITGGDALWQVFLVTGLLGVGLGYTFAAMPGLIVGAIPQHETGSAMGFYQVSRFVGFALGSGVAVTLLRAFGEGGVPTHDAYRMTTLVAAGLGVLTAVIAWVLPGRAAPVDHAFDEHAIEEWLARRGRPRGPRGGRGAGARARVTYSRGRSGGASARQADRHLEAAARLGAQDPGAAGGLDAFARQGQPDVPVRARLFQRAGVGPDAVVGDPDYELSVLVPDLDGDPVGPCVLGRVDDELPHEADDLLVVVAGGRRRDRDLHGEAAAGGDGGTDRREPGVQVVGGEREIHRVDDLAQIAHPAS